MCSRIHWGVWYRFFLRSFLSINLVITVSRCHKHATVTCERYKNTTESAIRYHMRSCTRTVYSYHLTTQVFILCFSNYFKTREQDNLQRNSTLTINFDSSLWVLAFRCHLGTHTHTHTRPRIKRNVRPSNYSNISLSKLVTRCLVSQQQTPNRD